MRRIHTALLSTLAVCGVAFAQGDKDKQPAETLNDRSVHSETVSAQQLRRAMNEEIQARLVAQDLTKSRLENELAGAHSGLARMDVQRRLHAAHLQTWRDILAIQLEYATLAGATEHAEHLAARIARLDEGLSRPGTQIPSRREEGEEAR